MFDTYAARHSKLRFVVALIFWVIRVVAGDLHKLGPFRSAAIVVRLTGAVIVLHGALILFLAGCYRWLCLPSWESAFYFSAGSYVTAGCGDVVLPSNWRMLGPLESIMGALMCGISVSVLFATVTRLVSREARSSQGRDKTREAPVINQVFILDLHVRSASQSGACQAAGAIALSLPIASEESSNVAASRFSRR